MLLYLPISQSQTTPPTPDNRATFATFATDKANLKVDIKVDHINIQLDLYLTNSPLYKYYKTQKSLRAC